MSDGFTQLKDLLPKAATKRGVSKEVRAALICDRARKGIRDIWGADVSGVRPLHFQEGVLMVEVENSALAQEVFMKKNDLIESVGEGVKEVRTRVKG